MFKETFSYIHIIAKNINSSTHLTQYPEFSQELIYKGKNHPLEKIYIPVP